MKRVLSFAFAFVPALALCAAAVEGVRAQAGVRPRAAESAETAPNGKDEAKASEAQTLYEDAAGYVERKFEEFRQKQVPYDRLLEQKTYQEQKDLALQNAARLAA